MGSRPDDAASGGASERRPRVVIDARDRPSLHLVEAWARRELLGYLVRRDVVVRYKATTIGIAWAVIQPVFAAIVFALFLGRLGRIATDGIDRGVFFLSGLVPWTYFASAIAGSSASIVENRALVTRVYFPRILLPLSAVLVPLVDAGLALVVLAVVLVASGYGPRASWVAVVPILGFAVLSAFAIGTFLAALNARFRDVRHAIPFGLQLWLFASPVAYPASIVPTRLRAAYALNPMASAIEAFRGAVTGRTLVGPSEWLVSGVVVALALVFGLRYFRRAEESIADVV